MKKELFLSGAMTPSNGNCASDNRTFAGVAYTGAMIDSHGWMRNVIIDIATLTIEPNLPLLLEHDTQRVIGTAQASKVGNQIHTSGTLLNTIDDDALSVCQKSQAGIVWQLSVGLFDYRIRELNEGETDTVNGLTVEYPAMILRHAKLREVSVVALGADKETSLAIFSAKPHQSKETKQMDLDQAKAEIAKLQADLSAKDAKFAELEAKFSAFQTEKRTNEVKALFTALGREVTEEAIKPYIAMDEVSFSVVAKDMQAMRPSVQHDRSLFSQQTSQHKPANAGNDQQTGSLLMSAVSQLTANAGA